MKACSSCKESMRQCMETHTFAFAHLYNDEKAMDMHIHDCYEIYYSISGGKQFLIDNCFYDIQPGDIFLINQFESHYLSQIDSQTHERIIMSIDPEYTKSLSTDSTDLDRCFHFRGTQMPHRMHLTSEEQSRFLYYIHKLSSNEGLGEDILDQAVFLEMMVFLNRAFDDRCVESDTEALAGVSSDSRTSSASASSSKSKERRTAGRSASGRSQTSGSHNAQVDAILSYINTHMQDDLSLDELSSHFYLSSSYICRIFKAATGTTINKYITAKRITLSKSLLSQGYSVNEACEACGFNDYSNYLKAFTKAVGISPKKYAQFNS